MALNFKKRALVLVLVLSFLFSAGVYAESLFTANISPINDKITSYEEAKFLVSIENKQSFKDTFRLSIDDISWNLQTEPLSDYFGGLDINPGSSKPTTLIVKPVQTLPFGQYKITLSIESQTTGAKAKTNLLILLRNPGPSVRDYVPDVGRLVEIEKEIDPRKEVLIKINLQNRNAKNINNIVVQLRSNLINKDLETALEPLEKKTITYKANLNALTKPQKDTLRVTLVIENQTLEPPVEENFEITDYSKIISVEQPLKSSFLKTTRTIVYSNEGNAKTEKLVEIEVSALKSLFISTKPDAFTIERDGKRYLAWQLSLEPNESTTITISESYRLLAFIVLLIIMGVILYYVTRSPVTIKKEAIVIGTKEEGISDVKVVLHIKNRSSNVYEKIIVTDRIPNIAEFEKEPETGTIKPTSVTRHEKKGIILKWELPSLERFEERIVSYKLKSKLNILGGFTLPPTVIRFYDKKGRERISKSRKVIVSG